MKGKIYSREIAHGAVLLALAVVLQSLRLIIPLPMPISTLMIGSLVNMMLAFTCCWQGIKMALILGVLLPIFAYFQGQLSFIFLIPIVMVGNSVYVLIFHRLYYEGLLIYKLTMPAVGKAFFMLGTAYITLELLGIEDSLLKKSILFGMSIPQLVTGIIGSFLALKLNNHLSSKI